MHKILLFLISNLAKILLKIKKPYIIGVTASAGKTTISRFVVQYLQQEFGENSVEFSRYNYNGEYGMPLTIIGAESGGKNIFLWIKVLFIFCKKIFQKYPKFLVLEYGIDHIGEMDFLLEIAVPDIAIIGEIVPNHMEQFKTEEAYRNEKLKITRAPNIILHENLVTFVNKEILEKSQIYWKNIHEICHIFAENISETKEWVHGEIQFYAQKFFVTIPMIGDYQIINVLPIFGIAKILDKNPKNIENFSKNFFINSGRSGLFDGIYDSKIIDGSYNGWFLSIIQGMKSTRVFSPEYKIFIFLGDMRELWAFEQEKHEELAHKAIDIFSHIPDTEFFLVGNVMNQFVEPIISKKFSTISGLSSRKIGKIIAEKMKNSDKKVLVFVKWSQNTIFLEEGIKEFLPKEYWSELCRQSKTWKMKKEKFFTKVENNPE